METVKSSQSHPGSLPTHPSLVSSPDLGGGVQALPSLVPSHLFGPVSFTFPWVSHIQNSLLLQGFF